ncbi:MAG: YIP1 family protein [Archangium sp.]
MLGSPDKTLEHARQPDGAAGSLLYACFSALVGSAPTWVFCFGGSLLVTIASRVSVPDASRPSTAAAGFAVLTVMTVAFAFLSEGISLCVEHALLMLGGTRPRFETTLRAHALSMSPYLLGLVPFCGALVCPLWAVALRVMAFQKMHGVGTGVAVLAASVPLVLLISLSVLPFLI